MKTLSTVTVLCGFTLFFAGVTLFVVWLRPTDGQTYTVFSSLLTGWAGALLMFLRGDKPGPPVPPTAVL